MSGEITCLFTWPPLSHSFFLYNNFAFIRNYFYPEGSWAFPFLPKCNCFACSPSSWGLENVRKQFPLRNYFYWSLTAKAAVFIAEVPIATIRLAFCKSSLGAFIITVHTTTAIIWCEASLVFVRKRQVVWIWNARVCCSDSRDVCWDWRICTDKGTKVIQWTSRLASVLYRHLLRVQ